MLSERSGPDTAANGGPSETTTSTPGRFRTFFTNISVATRLSLVALVVTLLSLSAAALVGLWRGNTLAEGLIEDRVVSVTDSRATTVESYISGVRRSVAALAASPGAVDAIERLSDGHRALAMTPVTADEDSALIEYYLTDVVPQLEDTSLRSLNVPRLIPGDAGAIRLQSLYTVPPEPDEDEPAIAPALLPDAGDGSEYSAAHAELHPLYAEIKGRSGFDDLYLIAAPDDRIVYSTLKRIDFATSLDVGPWSGSALSEVIETLAGDPSPGTTAVSDMTAYGPAFERPTMFVAAPVAGDNGVVGFVAVALSFTDFDAILSGGGKWDGFGESGESYLVGADGTMRTTARPFAASASEFLASTTEEGPSSLTDNQRRRMAATGTTALVQEVDIDLVRSASTEPGTVETTNYRGVPVLAAYRPLDIEGLDWVVITELSEDEIDDPIEDYVRNLLLSMALFVVTVTFVATRWSDRTMEPIRTIAARLRAAQLGDTGASSQSGSLPEDSPDEYVALADSIDEMLERLDERRAAAAARSSERLDLVRRFLPATVAQRSEQAGEEVLDHVANASVVVLMVEGLGDLLANRDRREVRDFLAAVIDELDALAVDLGLERIKVTGDRYYAICGATRPYLDHGPRAVRFALQAVVLVAEVSLERGQHVIVRAGVDAGSVSVGLADRAGLVYDAWGPAVSGASELARTAPSGQVAASAAVQRHLSDDFVSTDAASGNGTVLVVPQSAMSEESR